VNINRADLVRCLESVAPGLASGQETVEQSSCFVFKKGKILTFNEEVYCATTCDVNGLSGAVRSGPLLAILRALPDKEVEIRPGEGVVTVLGKARRGAIKYETMIGLPVDLVEKPGDWSPLPEEFNEAAELVHKCAGEDRSAFERTCVHFHPKRIEATDNFQLARYGLKFTGHTEPFLLRKESVKAILPLGMTKYSVTDGWCHFTNPSGVLVSCRKWQGDFPDLSKHFASEGTPVTLPKGLAEAAERALVFSSEDKDSDWITVDLDGTRVKVRGEGVSGWYTETKKAKFDGPPIKFLISPQLLAELVKNHTDCTLTDRLLKVDAGKFKYATVLNVSAPVVEETADA
jgi:hypothetical protein